MWCIFLLFYFFFQAEDGIRDGTVTGVQTCALPISPSVSSQHRDGCQDNPQQSPPATHSGYRGFSPEFPMPAGAAPQSMKIFPLLKGRSEERRVGKECRSWWGPQH